MVEEIAWRYLEKASIELTRNPKSDSLTKHIDITCHYVGEQVENKLISVRYYRTENMFSDIIANRLSKFQFEKFRRMFGLTEV